MRAEETAEERDRRETQNDEGGAPDRLEPGRIERARGEEHRDHHEREQERVGQELDRAARWARFASPAMREDRDAHQRARAQRDQLCLQQQLCRARLAGDLEDVVLAEAAEQHPDELQAERRHIREQDERPVERSLDSAGGICEEQMQEERGR